MIDHTYELEPVTWKPMLGALELLEKGDLNEEQPAFERLPIPSATRHWPKKEDYHALRLQWQRFLKRLKGFSQDQTLFERKPEWVPLIDVYVPPNVRASVSYEIAESAKEGAEIKILGSGFGSAGSVFLGEAQKFTAEGTGMSYQVELLITATKYVTADRKSLIRLDIHNESDHIKARLVDLPALGERYRFNGGGNQTWKIVHRIQLSGISQTGFYCWSLTAKKNAAWKAQLGVQFPMSLGIESQLAIESEHGENIAVGFEVPYGQDYVFYCPKGESPLVPFCDIEGNLR